MNHETDGKISRENFQLSQVFCMLEPEEFPLPLGGNFRFGWSVPVDNRKQPEGLWEDKVHLRKELV